jgi:hypothetical protein
MAAFAASLTACTHTQPVSYPMRAVLPLGKVEMTVESTEATSDMSRTGLLVHVRLDNLDGEAQARVAGQSWCHLFHVTDRDGKKFNCRRFLPADSYYQNFADGGHKAWERGWSQEDAYSPVPTEWIIRFDVPLDAAGFTLFIDNTFHQGTQPSDMSVALDR